MEPLALSILLFAAGMSMIAVAGFKMAGVADQLADRTGWGEAIIGGVFVGASTSLGGLVTSVTAAWNGYAGLAVSNALGGIAVQTTFLAVADFFYRQANLEHAAASEPNLLQGMLLIVLLSLPLLAASGPPFAFWHIHPVTPLMIGAYLLGLRLLSSSRQRPMWVPKATRETKQDEPERDNLRINLKSLCFRFAILSALISFGGWMLARAAIGLTEQTGLSASFVGGVLTAVSTSIPELVVAVTAVRRGALTLAVGDIIGGNTFDTLILAFSDVVFRKGSLYHAISTDEVFISALTILLVSILMVGLLKREKHGIANIGLESFLVLVCYLGGFAVILFRG